MGAVAEQEHRQVTRRADSQICSFGANEASR